MLRRDSGTAASVQVLSSGRQPQKSGRNIALKYSIRTVTTRHTRVKS